MKIGFYSYQYYCLNQQNPYYQLQIQFWLHRGNLIQPKSDSYISGEYGAVISFMVIKALIPSL